MEHDPEHNSISVENNDNSNMSWIRVLTERSATLRDEDVKVFLFDAT